MYIKLWYTGWGKNNTQIINDFNKAKEHGISGINFQYRAETITDILPFAQDMELQIWYVLLCQNNQKLKKEHPNWFMVSREGKSTLDFPPYVNYYRWLCPSKTEVKRYLISKIEELCQYPEISGIHLDYVRYPDVILPNAIQPDYNLDQIQEFPQFDFCYCDDCRRAFQTKHGIDPLKIENPQNNADWLKFRYDNITDLVNQIKELVHSYNKKISAAVFPSPLLARTLVRQDWQNWKLDEYYPMIYNNFYLEDENWISKITRFNRSVLGDKQNVYSGIYLPEFAYDFNILKKIINSGANGIALFEYNNITTELWEDIKSFRQGSK